MRLTARTLAILGSLLGLIIVWSTDQIVPSTTVYQAQMRIWLAARASGMTAYVVLTFVIAIGLILSHPVNKSTWKLSKLLFPWHENLFVFIVAFVVAHVVSIVLDPYAGVGIAGTLIPGMSSYRSVPVAIGTLALYALLVTGLTARYTKVLPPGAWLRIHRVSIVVWALSWSHGILAGTDSGGLGPLYVASGGVIIAAAAYRYWVGKQARPTFASSLPVAIREPDRPPKEARPPTSIVAEEHQ
jgi:sulfoxide reductase heme-binding subunit YedZ